MTRHQPDPETEATAMRVVMEHERGQERHVKDVSAKNLGYDVTSLDPTSGDLRLIEAKGLAGSAGTILLTSNERRVAEGSARLLLALHGYALPAEARAPGTDREPGPVSMA